MTRSQTGGASRAAVFLDRDGVLNEVIERDGRPGSPRRLAELVVPPGVAEAVARLRAAGLPALVVTNQPDVARGALPAEELDRMMAALRARIELDDAVVCPHDDGNGCGCRKPKPGMVLELARRWGVDPASSYLVGDTWKDVEAGRAAGCRTVLLRRSYNAGVAADHIADDLGSAVDWILAQSSGTEKMTRADGRASHEVRAADGRARDGVAASGRRLPDHGSVRDPAPTPPGAATDAADPGATSDPGVSGAAVDRAAMAAAADPAMEEVAAVVERGSGEGRAVESGSGHAASYLAEAGRILEQLDAAALEAMADALARLRDEGGRLFFLGVGGGAGHASHAATDFRKIAWIEAYAPTDNASELTARINDEGWERAYADYLRASRLSRADGVFVFSVGGGDAERGISTNIVGALALAREVGARVFGVVGRDGGHTARVADHCLVVPVVNPERVTAHTESFQALVWHLLVSHPKLQRSGMKWETVAR